MTEVPPLGLGGASLGDLFCKISNEQGLATVTAAYENGIRYFDTAPWYGLGLSEQRMGMALHDKPRDSYIMSTKVGRYLVPDPNTKPNDYGWSGGLSFRCVFVPGDPNILSVGLRTMTVGMHSIWVCH